jgi:hypothetical protein
LLRFGDEQEVKFAKRSNKTLARVLLIVCSGKARSVVHKGGRIQKARAFFAKLACFFSLF